MSQNRPQEPLRNHIVDEVRAVREALDAEAGHDVAKLAERARIVGEEYRRKRGLKVANLASDS